MSKAKRDQGQRASVSGAEAMRENVEAERLGNEGEPVASAVAGEGRCVCPPDVGAAQFHDRACPEHGDDRPGQTIVLPAGDGAPIVYPMLDTAILSALRDSLAGLSFSGILAKFPGADPATVSEALAALFQEGKVSRIMSDRLMIDDEPPQPMYVATFAKADPSPASPSPADLTAAVVDAMESLVSAQEAARQAASVVKAIEGCLARAIDAKARSLLKGGLCAIGGVTFRAKPPRKAKGQAEADPAALWTLERVEVKDMEAKERGRLERWAVGDGQRGRDLCPICKPIKPVSVSP